MAKRLRRLRILEGSLVDRPANQHARILLWKRDDPLGKNGENDMPALDEDTKQLLEGMQEQLGDLTKSNADLQKRAEEAEAKLAEAEGKITKLKKAKPGASPEDESDDDNPILKGISPVLKQYIDDLTERNKGYEERLSKQEERSEIEDCERKLAKRFPSLPFKPANFAPIYRKITKALAPDELASVDRIFASHAAFAQLADRELGHVGLPEGDGGADAWAQIEAKAKELRKADPKLTQEQAVAKAMDQDPRLYDQYRKEVM